jgi:hypothetical protein
VIGLNPSTADATKNDPTVTRCINFAKREGLRRHDHAEPLRVARDGSESDALEAADPIGPENDKYILAHCFANHRIVLAAWGVTGGIPSARRPRLRAARRRAGCLGHTKEGDPRHPLYIR